MEGNTGLSYMLIVVLHTCNRLHTDRNNYIHRLHFERNKHVLLYLLMKFSVYCIVKYVSLIPI